ncbi:MAG: hypothetical protein MJZ19_08100 [Paludibacteraceae bacterium]|nr:hypothetical protein [Paludibacteraceae bacterium]
MNKFFRLTALGFMALASIFATSCDDEEEGYYSKVPDNKYLGKSTLIAMGDTVNYENSVNIVKEGTVAVIDSIKYGRFCVKDFEIKNLKSSKTKNGWNIELTSKNDTIEKDGIKFVILEGNGYVVKTDGTFKFNILPVGMPSKTGFEFTLVGKKQYFDE